VRKDEPQWSGQGGDAGNQGPINAGGQDVEGLPIEMVPVNSMLVADSPRLSGESREHTRLLAQLDVRLPPIIVHRKTRRVIDGVHRLRAAAVRGDSMIEVRFFDGEERDAFVLAVKANVTHGLPLSLSDRKAAAERIIRSHSEWSNRAIASVVGLAPNTVSTIRRSISDEIPDVTARVGRDGRTRALDPREGRQIAAKLIQDNPSSSLREIATTAQISPETVRDVRNRLRCGKAPGPPQRGGHSHGDKWAPERGTTPHGQAAIDQMPGVLARLRQDPSLRFTESGRVLLRLLDQHTINARRWTQLADNVPPHCLDMIADMARRCAESWIVFTTQLDQRRDHTVNPPRRHALPDAAT
jgi:ParB-like chromosome segregation protein Spo0J